MTTSDLFEQQRLVPRRVHQLLEFAEMTPRVMRKPLAIASPGKHIARCCRSGAGGS